MSDLSQGILAAVDYSIPEYIRSKLLIQSQDEFISCHGGKGQFNLAYSPAARIILRWGSTDGAALIELGWQPETLGWEGEVAVSGYIDAISLYSNSEINRRLAVIGLGGQPLKREVIAHPFGTNVAAHLGLAADLPITITTWIVDQEDPMLSLAQEALFHNTTVQLWGRVMTDDDPLARYFDLPISLEGITAFSP